MDTYRILLYLSPGKMKLKCYSNAKSNERVQDALLDCKLGRGKVLSDRELVKLEGKRKKSGEQLKKSDLDYYAASLKAERARSVSYKITLSYYNKIKLSHIFHMNSP